jgi:hypothetical protein
MADDKKEDAPPDPERINTHDEAHMVYCSKSLIPRFFSASWFARLEILPANAAGRKANPRSGL